MLELLLVYGLDLGIVGSAWGTVVAQYGAALAYLVIVARAVRARGRVGATAAATGIRANARVGSRLVVRTASLIVALLTATAIASRISDDAVAAHQICVQVLLFLALALDALGHRGPGHGRALPRRGRACRTRARSGAGSSSSASAVGVRLRRSCVVVARPWLAGVFTDDPGVRHLALEVLWIVAAMQPVAAVVFVLDGVLIGAGDAGYLALAMLVATRRDVPARGGAARRRARRRPALAVGRARAVDAGPVRGHGRPLPHDALGGRGRVARA